MSDVLSQLLASLCLVHISFIYKGLFLYAYVYRQVIKLLGTDGCIFAFFLSMYVCVCVCHSETTFRTFKPSSTEDFEVFFTKMLSIGLCFVFVFEKQGVVVGKCQSSKH